ncbi:histidine kinase N-terminal 7TM domain-containing protein [Cohnella kolymensis]|uniref:histidine kinase N-terminal 7TM domain-containing protein n=1 Tax=Cohnella kolymensis TaxID=1590652 RepID=UPI000696E475|nr:histidine kinase N-terminal 7TM domain-containing protein [Cohnella kolymensis]
MALLWPDLMLFALLFILFVCVMAFNRITQTHKVYLVFHFLMMLWPLGQFAVVLTEYPGIQLFFVNISFLAMGMLGPGWLIFVFFLTGRVNELTPRKILAYFAPSLLCIIAAAWNPQHLFMSPVGGSYIDRVYGPLFWVLVLVQFAYFFSALMSMFHALKTVKSLNQRRQLATALIGMFVLTGFGLLDLSRERSFGPVVLPIIPGLLALGILLSDVCFVVAISRFGMFDILSLAQKDIFQHMATGIVVVERTAKCWRLTAALPRSCRSTRATLLKWTSFWNLCRLMVKPMSFCTGTFTTRTRECKWNSRCKNTAAMSRFKSLPCSTTAERCSAGSLHFMTSRSCASWLTR